MILPEMDQISARKELIPRLQEILTDLEHDKITKDHAIDMVKEIQTDVRSRILLTSPSPKDIFEWNFLRLTIDNILLSLDE